MKLSFLPILLAIAPLAGAQTPTDSPTVDASPRMLAPGAKVEKLADGFQFVEGPAWNQRGFWVFSDIPANSLWKITPAGKKQLIRNPSGNSNGNAYDRSGALISMEHSGRRVSRKNERGTFDTLVARFEGKRLNSPNDLAIKSDGSIYFTDPTYGTGKAQLELDFRGVYRLFPDGRLELLDKIWTQPNGICFSPDETVLYVGDSQAGDIFRFDVDKNGAVSNKTLLAKIPKPGDPDGMKCDAAGNLLVTGPGGIWVFAPRGGLLGLIPTPQSPANIAFGGADGKTLFITARDSVYSVRMRVGGAKPLAARR